MAPEGGGTEVVRSDAEQEVKPQPLKEAIQVYDDKKTGLVDKLIADPKTVLVLEKARDNGLSLAVTDSVPPSLVILKGEIEIPGDTPQGGPLTVNIVENAKWQEDLVVALEKAIVKINKPRFYASLETRSEQGGQLSSTLADADKPGKLHEELETDIGKIPESTATNDFNILSGKTAQAPKADGKEAPKKDAETAPSEPVTIEDIRYNSRLLKKEEAGEEKDDALVVKNLKEEMARRIKAYTTTTGDGWFKLDYARLGSDKNGMSHELYVGLGDILVYPGVQNIIVERDGQIIKAHRGEVDTDSQKGRNAFIDEQGNYVATHTGDRFRILSNDEIPPKECVVKYKEEKTRREAHRMVFKASTTDLYVAEKDFSMNDIFTLDSKDVNGKDIPSDAIPTKGDIETAAAKCAKSSTIEKAAEKNKELMKCLNYIAARVGVPSAGVLAVLYHECGIKFPAGIGDSGLAVGMGQIHPEGWNSVKKDPRFSAILTPLMKESPGMAARNKNIFVDLVGVAIFMKKGIEKFGFTIDHTTPMTYLTDEIVTAPDGVGMPRMAWVRSFYHVPAYAGDYSKIIKAGNIDALSPKYKERFYAKSQPWFKKNMHRYVKLADNTRVAARSMEAAGVDGRTAMA